MAGKELVVVVDAVDEACASSLQEDAVARFGLLAGLTTVQTTVQGPTFQVGLCAVQKQDNGRDVQLKVT